MKMLNTAEFADLLGVKRTRVSKWIQRGHLHAHNVGSARKPYYLIERKERKSVHRLMK